jgi:hypothetical protein
MGGGAAEPTVRLLLGAAIDYATGTPDTAVHTVYFLAYTDAEHAAFTDAIAASRLLSPDRPGATDTRGLRSAPAPGTSATADQGYAQVVGPQPVTVVLVREAEASRGYDLALVATQAHATASQIVERYASRWAVEVAIEDAKQLAGVGQAHNPKARAVERTVPFGLACLSLAVCWYATTGHQPEDVTEHRTRRPWYRTKTNPSTADMLTKLRRVLIATRFQLTRPEQPTPAELHTIRLAWEDPAA